MTQELPLLAFRAAVEPESLNEEKRTVEVVWTTGARVLRGFFEQYYEELSLDPNHVRMERLRSGAPLLDNHGGLFGGGLESVIGVVESAKLESERGVATVRFRRNETADEVFAAVKDGVLRHVSVGYRVHKMVKVEDGEGEIPVYRAEDWEPYEISMVPMGADAGAGVRSANVQTNPCEFLAEEKTMAKIRKSKNVQPATTAANARADEAEQEEPTDGDQDDGDTGDDDADEADDADSKGEADKRALVAQGMELERKRRRGIERWARALGIADQTFVTRHLEGGTEIVKFKVAALKQKEAEQKETHPDVGGPDIESVRGGDSCDKWVRGLTHWLLLRSTVSNMMADAAKKRGEAVPSLDPGEFRGFTLQDICRSYLERNGVRTAGLGGERLVVKALEYRAGGYHTTSDLTVLFGGVVHQTLLASYAVAPDTWRQFAKIGSVSDFRPHERIRVGTFGRLDKVNEHGEFKNKPIPDGAKEPISAHTRGNIVGITRQMLVNDDLGALTDLAARLGRAAALTIELLVYDLLNENSGLGPTMADGFTLFHANHNNISGGAGTTIGVEALDADRVLMAQQKDPENNEILDIRPRILLLPIGLEGLARVTVEAEFDVDAGDGTTPNRIKGMFPVIVGSPRLSGARRYLFADPNVIPTIEVVFLNGQQTPFLDTMEGWRIDGIEYKVRHDVGVGVVDWRGAVTNDGTP